MQISTPSNSSSEKGFTFIEVLITTGLALMVVTLAFTSLYYSSRASRDCRIKTNLDFELMKVYAQMRQQMLNLYVANDLYNSLIGEKTVKENQNTIRFFTTSPIIGRGIVEADYSIQQTEDGKAFLAYREFPFPHIMEPGESLATLEASLKDSGINYEWRKVSDAIVGLTFGYRTETQELLEWKGNTLPNTIVVSLWYTSKSDVQSFSFTVAPGLITSISGSSSSNSSSSDSSSSGSSSSSSSGSSSSSSSGSSSSSSSGSSSSSSSGSSSGSGKSTDITGKGR